MTILADLMNTNNAAVVFRHRLKPVEGDGAIVFPPTYADVGYNIDDLSNLNGEIIGNVCAIDSVGSQANRMEPIFKEPPYSKLVPSVTVRVEETGAVINLLDAGHRIADAIVRFSSLYGEVSEAFEAARAGNMVPLAKLAPTSLVFGCWDSRDTGTKIPRIVRSNIRGLNVHPLTRSATYFIPTNYVAAGALTEKEAEEAEEAVSNKPAKASEVGLANALSTGDPGGVLLTDESLLLREAVLSLAALRRLSAGGDANKTEKLRKYILGLSLVVFTAPQDTFLRMGCELTPDPDFPAKWELVKHDGTRELFSLAHDDALHSAQEAAKAFGVGNPKSATFEIKRAKNALEQAKAKKKAK